MQKNSKWVRIDDPELGRIEITAIPLRSEADGKDPLPGWLKPQRSNFRVFHAVNGQVQFKQTRGYLSNWGYSGIKDRVVIVVDASRLTEGTNFNLWKGDRENIIQNATGERYLEAVSGIIGQSPSLNDWKQKVAQEDLRRIATTDTNDLFQKLVDSDRELITLLDQRDPTLKLPKIEPQEETFVGKYDPTFLNINHKLDSESLEIPLNKPRAFVATTDAVNDFFIRADNQGRLLFSDHRISECFTVKHILHNGRLTVFLSGRRRPFAAG